jgi:hypothetical protein
LDPASLSTILKTLDAAQNAKLSAQQSWFKSGSRLEAPRSQDLQVQMLADGGDGERLDLILFEKKQPGLYSRHSSDPAFVSVAHGLLSRNKQGHRFHMNTLGIDEDPVRKSLEQARVSGSLRMNGQNYGLLETHGYESFGLDLIQIMPDLFIQKFVITRDGC